MRFKPEIPANLRKDGNKLLIINFYVLGLKSSQVRKHANTTACSSKYLQFYDINWSAFEFPYCGFKLSSALWNFIQEIAHFVLTSLKDSVLLFISVNS